MEKDAQIIIKHLDSIDSNKKAFEAIENEYGKLTSKEIAYIGYNYFRDILRLEIVKLTSSHRR